MKDSKKCTRCGLEKKFDEFCERPSNKDGLSKRCIGCIGFKIGDKTGDKIAPRGYKKKLTTESYMAACRELSEKCGGELLSESCSKWGEVVEFRCGDGHVFKDTLRHATKYWCKKCRRKEMFYRKHYNEQGQKKCSQCGEYKDTSLFYASKSIGSVDELTYRCKECDCGDSVYYRNRYIHPEGKKECSECGKVKDLGRFHKGKHKCKMCCNGWDQEEDLIREQNSLPEGYKRCNVCKEVKPLEEFYNYVGSKDGKQAKCKGCTRKYQTENKDRIAAYHKVYQPEYQQGRRRRG